MITQCERGLGWPIEDQVDQGEEIAAELEEHRDHFYPEWSRERGIFNFAILIARGFFRSRP